MKIPAGWFLMMLGLFVFATLSASIPLRPDENTNRTSSLNRRQCNWVAAINDFVCDEWLPSLNQIKQRLFDTANGGQVTSTTTPFFHTNLWPDEPTPERKTALYKSMIAQLTVKGIDKYYYDLNALNALWLQKTLQTINHFGKDMDPTHPIFSAEALWGMWYSQALAEVAQTEVSTSS